MGFCCKATLIVLVVLIAFGFQTYINLGQHIPIPKLDLEQYWGPGKSSAIAADKSIKPFKVAYSQHTIQTLIDQLNKSKFQEPLEGTAFEYGFNGRKLKQLVDYWKNEYLPNWSKREDFLNKFPQFTTVIQGLNIHFIHAKPTGTNANTKVYPVILLHGWPGTVREFYDMIPMLTKTTKDNIAFEVIVPSLPGYGFSQAAAKKGLGPTQMAIIFRNLMVRLGLDKFYVQGGDWGAMIGAQLASAFPENVLGYHSNMCVHSSALSPIKTTIASFYPSFFIVDERLAKLVYPFLPNFLDWVLQESGYMHIQATKPDTIGATLLNNPVGLAAYIIEKFSTWTNREYRNLADGGLEKYFTLDALLDNIMIYYLTDTIATSQRLYKECFSEEFYSVFDYVPLSPPSGCAHFAHEIMHTPGFILKEKYTNLIHETVYDDGGHFAAMQLPKVFYEDFMAFVRKAMKQ